MSKITLTIDLPDDFTPKEIKYWKLSIISMAGYHVKEIISNRLEGIRKEVERTIKFEEDTND